MTEETWLGWTLEDIANDPDGYIALVNKTYPRPARRNHKKNSSFFNLFQIIKDKFNL